MPLLAALNDRWADVVGRRSAPGWGDIDDIDDIDAADRAWFAPRRTTRCLDAPVIAVLRDGPDDVVVAGCAARRAQREGRRLILLIPLPSHSRALGEEAAAIAARVRPELDRVGMTASVRIAPYADSLDPRRRERRALAAVDRIARQLRSAVVLFAVRSLSARAAAPGDRSANDQHRAVCEVNELVRQAAQ